MGNPDNYYNNFVDRRAGRNITGKPVKWYDTPPGLPEGSAPHLRVMREYGANWVFGIKGTF